MRPFRYQVLPAFLFALTLLLPGCNRKTPEERLQMAGQYIQAGDTISAEMEARKVIEKAPDDPASLQARWLLAQIYFREERLDEARGELETILGKTTQKERLGVEAFKAYLVVLQKQQDYKAAFAKIDEFQQQYADDEGTSLNLRMARVDLQINSGESTPALETLTRLREETTSPAHQALYRDQMARTYHRNGDTTGAIAFYEKELATAPRDEDRRQIVSILAQGYAQLENFEKTREYLIQATQLYDSAVQKELDANVRSGQTVELGHLYTNVGNLAGGRIVYQALFDSNPQDPQLVMATADGLIEIFLRQGQYDALVGFMKEAAGRYPSLPFAQRAGDLEQMIGRGELQVRAPQDTSTLVMRWKEAELLVPQNLPKATTGGTTATLSRDEGTTPGAPPAEAPATTGTAAAPVTPSADSGTTTGA